MNPNHHAIRSSSFSVLGSPRDLRVFDETISTMKLAWQPARGNVLQYSIVYKPAEGGDRNEITVKGDTTQALLKNLQPATEYELFVSARYTSGVGDPLIGTGTTLEGKGDVKPLMHARNVFITAQMYGLSKSTLLSWQTCFCLHQEAQTCTFFAFYCCLYFAMFIKSAWVRSVVWGNILLTGWW